MLGYWLLGLPSSLLRRAAQGHRLPAAVGSLWLAARDATHPNVDETMGRFHSASAPFEAISVRAAICRLAAVGWMPTPASLWRLGRGGRTAVTPPGPQPNVAILWVNINPPMHAV